MRRTLTILLHWLNLVLLILLLSAGPLPALAWTFVFCSFAMVTMALFGGLLNGPGPKLEGVLRAAHPWFSWAMYAALAIVAGATLLFLLGRWAGPIPLPDLYFYLLSAASLHGIFHLWRHTALGDGALRRITPRSFHDVL